MGDFLSPSLYPYASREMLGVIQANARNNPRSIPLISGYTFDRLLYSTSTPITTEKIESETGRRYQQINIGQKISPLPLPDEDRNLVRPKGIILHTDDQSLNCLDCWVTEGTYNGLLSRNTNVHFAVGLDGTRQFLPAYPDFVNPAKGSPGFSNYISIEMCGRDYSRIMGGQYNSAEAESAVDSITSGTLNLVTTLIRQYDIPKERILGHHEASASGKSDPGDTYMEYFRNKLDQRLKIENAQR
jgi:hypothetical protein